MGKRMGMSKSLVLMVLVVVAVVGMEAHGSAAAVSNAQCKEERRAGLKECKAVLSGKRPSAACCERIRVAHAECICPLITRKLAALIDVNRAIHLVQGCGRRVPRHFKCGSITTP